MCSVVENKKKEKGFVLVVKTRIGYFPSSPCTYYFDLNKSRVCHCPYIIICIFFYHLCLIKWFPKQIGFSWKIQDLFLIWLELSRSKYNNKYRCLNTMRPVWHSMQWTVCATSAAWRLLWYGLWNLQQPSSIRPKNASKIVGGT